jgi:hypothetical protein
MVANRRDRGKEI